jgi:hypothetical protein
MVIDLDCQTKNELGLVRPGQREADMQHGASGLTRPKMLSQKM